MDDFNVLENRLKRASLSVTKKICDVRTYVSKEEMDNLLDLEQRTGKKWDAINERWCPLDD